jgi:hypothetical protein
MTDETRFAVQSHQFDVLARDLKRQAQRETDNDLSEHLVYAATIIGNLASEFQRAANRARINRHKPTEFKS